VDANVALLGTSRSRRRAHALMLLLLLLLLLLLVVAARWSVYASVSLASWRLVR